jgi:hypothetical protein
MQLVAGGPQQISPQLKKAGSPQHVSPAQPLAGGLQVLPAQELTKSAQTLLKQLFEMHAQSRMHALPFSAATTGAYWQPRTGSHVSTVHASLSSQTTAVVPHVPLWQTGLLQASPAGQSAAVLHSAQYRRPWRFLGRQEDEQQSAFLEQTTPCPRHRAAASARSNPIAAATMPIAPPAMDFSMPRRDRPEPTNRASRSIVVRSMAQSLIHDFDAFIWCIIPSEI